jgi:hypothetical protein
MKTRKTIPEISSAISTGQSDQTKLRLFKNFSLPIGLAIISIGLSFIAKPVKAAIEDIHPYYRYVPYQGPGSTAGTAGQQRPKQPSGASEAEAKKEAQATSPGGQAPASSTQPSTAGQKESKAESPVQCEHEQKPSPVGKPKRDTGEFPSGDIPSFCQVDVNGDHYITKDELQNFPDLVRIFDKVDAGKDGRLEQHEYQNLEMEAKREGEIM